jgi:phosphopantothenoylcysteine decarboxylase/phosphopantothenate--cysteine ligase
MKSSILKNKKILLAVTGGIAAYKSAELIQRIKEEDASVTVLMTEAAQRFITPLTLQTLSSNPVYTDIFSAPLSHIELAVVSDALLIAPASANTIAKMASGMADNIVTLSYLAFKGPVILVPAMNWRMYEHPSVKRNIQILKDRGCIEVVPEEGILACGEKGRGRMASVERIVETLKYALSPKDLKGKKIVVTAGPTVEPIDPIRYISNRSSGKMGYAIARVARRRGAEVVLITGPTEINSPDGVETIYVETAEQMLDAVVSSIKNAYILVMAAAVADFTVERYSDKKYERDRLQSLKLKPTVDIIKTVSSLPKRPFIIGFSAETGPNIARAKRKMAKKGMDMIVFNNVLEEGSGFGTDTNRIVIIDRNTVKELPLISKEECAEEIFNHALTLLEKA